MLEEIITKTFPDLLKNLNLHIQEILRNPHREFTKKTTLKHVIVTHLKYKLYISIQFCQLYLSKGGKMKALLHPPTKPRCDKDKKKPAGERPFPGCGQEETLGWEKEF